jgi:uncharacterized protein (DUF952 family)
MNINLYELLTVSREEMLREGGVYIETLNANEDGVVYIRTSTLEQVIETATNQPQGELQ